MDLKLNLHSIYRKLRRSLNIEIFFCNELRLAAKIMCRVLRFRTKDRQKDLDLKKKRFFIIFFKIRGTPFGWKYWHNYLFWFFFSNYFVLSFQNKQVWETGLLHIMEQVFTHFSGTRTETGTLWKILKRLWMTMWLSAFWDTFQLRVKTFHIETRATPVCYFDSDFENLNLCHNFHKS